MSRNLRRSASTWVALFALTALAIAWPFPSSGLAPPPVAHAQGSGGLSGEVKWVNVARRTSAPFEIAVILNWESDELLQGHLELVVHRLEDPAHRFRSEPLSISKGSRHVRFLVPPVADPGSALPEGTAVVRASAVFVTRTGRNIEISRDDTLYTNPIAHRTYLTAAIVPDLTSMSSRVQGLVRFDRNLLPPASMLVRPTVTHPTFIAAAEVASHPLSFTPYNLITVDASGLTLLDPAQLEALAVWVRGGGSLFMRGGAGFRKEHLAFVRLLASPDARASIDVDEFGNLQLPGRVLLSRPGVGRCAIVSADFRLDSKDPTTPADEAALIDRDQEILDDTVTPYLWRLRMSVEEIRQEIANEVARREGRRSVPDSWRNFVDFSQLPEAAGERVFHSGWQGVTDEVVKGLHSSIRSALTFHELELVPPQLVIGMLAVFLLVIGPVDYWFLGRIGRRRWTWLTLPAAAVLFTALMLSVSNRYLEGAHTDATLTLLDIDETGDVVRQNRFCYLLAKERGDVEVTADGTWHTPLPKSDSSPSAPVGLYVGRAPGRYEVRQERYQWDHTFWRTFTFSNDVSALEYPPLARALATDWDRYDTTKGDIFTRKAQLQSLIRLEGVVQIGVLFWDFDPNGRKRDAQFQHVYPTGGSSPLSPNLLERLTCLTTLRFSPVAVHAPTGSPRLEDIPIAAPGDHVLIVVLKDGDDYFVIRKLYGGDA